MNSTLHRSILLLVSIGLVISATVALAAGEAPVPSYTGCLNLSSGTLGKFAEGESAKGGCATTEVPVRLSGGDITAVSTPPEGGLDGGSDSGPAALTLQPGFRLPQGCAAGDVAKMAVTWECATDEDTTYSAGGGLALSGTEFSVEPRQRLPQGCSPGQAVGWNGSAWTCRDERVSRVLSWSSRWRFAGNDFYYDAARLEGPEIPFCGYCVTTDGRHFRSLHLSDGVRPVTLLKRMEVPAGSYLFMAKTVLYNGANFEFQDNSRTAACWLSTSTGVLDFAYLDLGSPDSGTIALTVAATLTEPGDVELVCHVDGGAGLIDESAFVGQGSSVFAGAVKLNALRVDQLEATTG